MRCLAWLVHLARHALYRKWPVKWALSLRLTIQMALRLKQNTLHQEPPLPMVSPLTPLTWLSELILHKSHYSHTQILNSKVCVTIMMRMTLMWVMLLPWKWRLLEIYHVPQSLLPVVTIYNTVLLETISSLFQVSLQLHHMVPWLTA